MTKAEIKMNDAFNPTHVVFIEGKYKIEFFKDTESIRIQVFENDKFVQGMRLPLYASIALAQVFTSTLNGQRLFK